MRFTTAAVAACAAAALLGCATRSSDVRPQLADGGEFAGWDCTRLQAELERTQRHVTARAYKVDERVGNNVFAFSLGAMVFWPALLAMRSDGEDAADLARLKGRAEALQQAQRSAACPAPADEMTPERLAALPIRLGDRLVYDERAHAAAAPSRLALRLVALKRDELDFAVEAGTSSAGMLLRQDLAGNALGPAGGGLLQWRRLLDPDLSLGQTITGELVAADDPETIAPVTAELVALAPQTIAGRRFEAAVLELRGGAPRDGEGSTRLTGVMAVDRSSGVLLRLELTCSNPTFAVWRRLVRIDGAP